MSVSVCSPAPRKVKVVHTNWNRPVRLRSMTSELPTISAWCTSMYTESSLPPSQSSKPAPDSSPYGKSSSSSRPFWLPCWRADTGNSNIYCMWRVLVARWSFSMRCVRRLFQWCLCSGERSGAGKIRGRRRRMTTVRKRRQKAKLGGSSWGRSRRQRNS